MKRSPSFSRSLKIAPSPQLSRSCRALGPPRASVLALPPIMERRVAAFALSLLCLAACKSEQQADAEAEVKPAPAEQKLATDPPKDSEPTPVKPLGAHLDGTDTEYRPRDYQPNTRDGKPIELFLRSTPPGASAAMDGKAIGITPTFWSGIADRQSHEFTFVKAGYAMARYRFVATQNGVVHGTLKPLAKAPPPAGDAGFVEHR